MTNDKPLRFFLAGIMQGSHVGNVLHRQDYRAQIREILTQTFPHAEIYDPLAEHTESLRYDDPTGRSVFMHHNRMCREVDVLLAFIPEASMGTAIEMWEAYQHGAAVISISPLTRNWAVKFLSHEIYADFEAFQTAARKGHLAERIAAILKDGKTARQ